MSAYPRKSDKSLSVCLSVCPVTSLADLTITELPDIRYYVNFKSRKWRKYCDCDQDSWCQFQKYKMAQKLTFDNHGIA